MQIFGAKKQDHGHHGNQGHRHDNAETSVTADCTTYYIVAQGGTDLGKNVFHIVGMNARGAVVLRERLSRAKLARRLTNMTSCLIGMEPCAGALHVGQQLAAVGHDVRLIPAKYLKPFLAGATFPRRHADRRQSIH